MTTNNITNKKYIGLHYGELEDSYIGSGVLLAKAIKKYGKENFTKSILAIGDLYSIDMLEMYYINKYNAINDENFYNIADGGRCQVHNLYEKWKKEHPEEVKKQAKENGIRVHKWLKEHPEVREKLNQNLIKEAEKWRENHPEEMAKYIKKAREAMLKWQEEHPEEHKKQVEEWRKKGSEANSKKVKCTTTGIIFESISEAGRFYNVPQGNISKALKGERKSAGKEPGTGKKLFWVFV